MGDEKDKETMRNMQYDMQNILKAKSNKNNEDMEAALHSSYGNRHALQEKGVEEAAMKDFDEKVDAILGMKQLSQDEKDKETMRNMQYDMQNILKAKNNQDNEDMEAALHSFYGNRKPSKDNGGDEGVVKEFIDAVDVILKK